MTIPLKTKDEISLMRSANLIVHEVLQALQEMVVPGVTTADLDRKARELTNKAGAVSAFLDYPSSSEGVIPFPGVICSSRNEEIVHGIPNDVPLKEGDIISIDYGCCYKGYFGDSAITVAVGKINAEATRLLEVTKQSLQDAIAQCRSGNRIGDISAAVQRCVEAAGFGVVREFVGHGIGRAMHEPPQVPNFGKPEMGRILKPGMVLAIEPMVTVGSFDVKVLDDGWTAVTRDGSLAAHFEHTVAITNSDPFVLSRP